MTSIACKWVDHEKKLKDCRIFYTIYETKKEREVVPKKIRIQSLKTLCALSVFEYFGPEIARRIETFQEHQGPTIQKVLVDLQLLD